MNNAIFFILMGPPDYILCRWTYVVIFAVILLVLSSFFFFFVRQLSSELVERNSSKTGHMFGSGCDLKMYMSES